MSRLLPKFDFKAWIEENRHLLKPPVGNKCVWENEGFIVMVVGGPNARKDYHFNQTPEFFYQIEGDVVLKVIDEGEAKDIAISEGEIYLLPANIPHSPQRGPQTVGLVIEQQRDPEMVDGLAWYCENCGNELYKESFLVKDIETDLPKIYDKFYGSDTLCTCDNCGQKMDVPRSMK